MVQIKSFQALRPLSSRAAQVACLPYDVVSQAEAKRIAQSHPWSFMRVERPDWNLPLEGQPPISTLLSEGKAAFNQLQNNGSLIKDPDSCFYLYQQNWQGRQQNGLVCLVSAEDYHRQLIKRHEKTLPAKVKDRSKAIEHLRSFFSPVFLTFHRQAGTRKLWQQCQSQPPLYQFQDEQTVSHRLWKVADPDLISALSDHFQNIPALYVADGHHRCEAAATVYQGQQNPAWKHFLAVLFPADELTILAYNRLIKDLGSLSTQEFLQHLKNDFNVQESTQGQPAQRGTFGMRLNKQWFHIKPKNKPSGLIAQLDVSILQDQILAPLLGVTDPRRDPRLEFVGGIRGEQELADRCDQAGGVAFMLYPTAINDLLKVADQGQLMPPKSTWFEPKLRSGLFVQTID